MDDVAEFEIRFERRVRAFATRGIRPVDSSAVARAVAGSQVGGFGTRAAERVFGRPTNRWFGSIVLAAASILVLAVLLPPLLSGRLGLGASPAPTSLPTLAPTPTASTTETLTGLGVAYGIDGDGFYVADWDGASVVQVLDEDSADKCGSPSSITVSPDGRFIAYRTGIYGPDIDGSDDCAGELRLHVMDTAGRNVASFRGWGEVGVAWSHDSSLLATWVSLDEFPPAIAIYGVDGVRHALIEVRGHTGERDVGWARDGAPSVYDAKSPEQLFPIDGSAPYRVVDPPAWSGEPWSRQSVIYSPGGERVAVITEASLMITTRDGETVHELTYNPSEGVVWSPSGEYIAYENLGALRLANVQTGTVTTLPIGGPIGRVQVFGFSPDGQHILVTVGRGPRSEVGDLLAVNTDGTGTRKIAERVSTAGWILAPDDN